VFFALRTALQLFQTRKVRFLLTVSGILVGIASLVLLAGLLDVGQEVLRRASSSALGDDTLTVKNDWNALSNNPDAERLTFRDQEAIERSASLGDGTGVTGAYGIRDRKATFGKEEFTPLTLGVEPSGFEVYELEIANGRSFVADEYDQARRVAIAGAKILDGRLKPGDVVRVEGSPFEIVGILEAKPTIGPGENWGWNNRLLMPARTYQLVFDPSRRPSNIVVKLAIPESLEGAIKDYVLAERGLLDAILFRGRTVKSWEYEGVGEQDSTEALIFKTIHVLIYLTTVFSMIVGGINIMNIMLVTVAERTREIGLRRALGATRTDILRQFVAETMAVTLMGALLGLAMALLLLVIASLALTKWVVPWPVRVVPWAVLAAVGSSMTVGIVFGLYPAWRASRLDPVEALRFE
jgi:putative ABC transport system permease protein